MALLALTFSVAAFAQNGGTKPLIVGYFGQWGLYNDVPYTLRDLAVGHKAAMLNQLNYAQAFVTGGHCSVADPNADLNHVFTARESVSGVPDEAGSPFRGHLHQLAELKQAFPRLRTLISLEGRGSDFAFDARPENRKAFVTSCVSLFITGNLAAGVSVPRLFDGIDVDWEYPGGADAANFLALLTEFRQQMDAVRHGLTLSIAVGPSPRMYAGTDFASVVTQVDQVGLMTYDFAGPWMQTTGFIAPLFSVPAPAEPVKTIAPGEALPHLAPSGGVAGSAQAFLAAGVPATKLLLGVPFYGYGWTQVPEAAMGVFQEGTPIRGDRPYSYIRSLTTTSTIYRDPDSQAPWLFDGDVFWTFDDAISMQAKAAYALAHGLGGIMIWELSGDTDQATLLTALHQALTGFSPALKTY